MKILDVIYHFRATEAVFKRHEEMTGICIRCDALFETVADAADKYRLDLADLLDELRQAAEAGRK